MSVIHLDEKEFDRLIMEEKQTVLVDFWAEWCGPCRMLAPFIEELAGEVPEGVLVAKVDVDREQNLAARYGVMSIPTVISFRDGQEHKRVVGFVPKNALADLLD